MRSLRVLFVLAATSLASGVGACSLLTNLDGFTCSSGDCSDGASLDAPGTVDGASDAPGSTDGPGPGADASVDARPNDGGGDADSGPPPLTYSCGGSKVADCASCAGATYPCVLCGSSGADKTKLIGVCVTSATSGSACEGKGPPGYDDCLCTLSPGPCVEPYQICLQPFGPACRTCGYDGGDGLPCKGGGTCTNGACL